MNAIRIRKALPDAAWRRLEMDLGMPALLVTPARALDDIAPAPSRLPPNVLAAMTALLGADRVLTGLAARAAHTGTLGGQLRLRQGDLGAVPDAVLTPRDEADVLALLRICADAGVVVGAPSSDAVHVALNLAALNAMEPGDALSSRVRAGGGLSVAALDAALAGRGLMPSGGDPDLTVAAWAGGARGLSGLRLATAQGLVTVEDDPPLASVVAPFGVVTSATLAVQRRPAATERVAWRFPDFAAGLAALREAALTGIVMVGPQLSDEEETRLFDSIAPERGMLASLLARLRHQQDGGAMLSAAMTRADLARFKLLAQRLGARPVPPQDRMANGALAAALLERGAAMDRISRRTGWGKLPGLYAGARAALHAAMRRHAPRDGANGLVMGSVREVDADGARLTVAWLYARRLGEDAAQTAAIRARAQAALAREADRLALAARAALRKALDPAGIVQPLP